MLPDLLRSNLHVVFCGTAAGTKSAERGAYYAGPGNQFYATLAKTKLTPSILNPKQYTSLLKFGIGLTDLNKKESGMDHQLSRDGFDIESFNQKITLHQPYIIAFNGKESAKAFFQLRNTRSINFGEQSATLGRTRIFVLPSTSGAARGYWDEHIWQILADEVHSLRAHSA